MVEFIQSKDLKLSILKENPLFNGDKYNPDGVFSEINA